jgi:putative membrane protein
MTVPTMFESGLQPERTALAWRRTVISLLLGSVVASRLLAGGIGGWALAVGASGVVLTGLIWFLAAERGRRANRAVTDGEFLPGGGLLLLLSVVVAAAAAVGIVYVLV